MNDGEEIFSNNSDLSVDSFISNHKSSESSFVMETYI